MEIVPLLHVRDGAVVRGRPGGWETLETPYPDGGSDVAGLARHLFVRFQRVALVDLGTGRMGDADHNLYQKLSKQQVALWVDAGPESLEDVLDLFVAGADRVTVRMDRMDPDDLVEVLEMADGEVWLGYAYHDVGGLREALRETDPYRFLQAGAQGIVLIDLARAGGLEGPDPEAVHAVPYKDVPVYVAGGVATAEHVQAMRDAGAAGVLVGSALLDDVDGWAKLAEEHREASDPEKPTAPSEASFTVESPTSPLPGVLPGSGPKSRHERDR